MIESWFPLIVVVLLGIGVVIAVFANWLILPLFFAALAVASFWVPILISRRIDEYFARRKQRKVKRLAPH